MAKLPKKAAPRAVSNAAASRAKTAAPTNAKAKPKTKPKVGEASAVKRAAVAKTGAKAKKLRTLAGAGVLAWEDDPMTVEAAAPVPAAVPVLDSPQLGLTIVASRIPPAASYPPGSAEFRYWAAAEALARARDFWKPLLPPGTDWQTGGPLPVRLDRGIDLNAYYDRQSLSFFHDVVAGQTVYSGESPDVLCHELGHAILDAIKPQLWDASYDEVAAFHESFGDVSALLSALQVKSLRTAVLAETGGRLYRSSRLSRLAEQLGWAILQVRPDQAEADCLRNAVNTLYYHDPVTIPPSGPVSTLSSEPHNFSRVFTGAFFEALAGMLATVQSASGPTEANLADVAQDIGSLLVTSLLSASVVPNYYSQVAAGMIAVGERGSFKGKYRDALKSAFVRHGILSLEAAASVGATPPPTAAARAALGAAPGSTAAAAASALQLPGKSLGLGVKSLLVHAPEEARWSIAESADLGPRPLPPPSRNDAVVGFVTDLLRRGRVEFGNLGDLEFRVAQPQSRKTHTLVQRPGGDRDALELRRDRFDCGFGHLPRAATW